MKENKLHKFDCQIYPFKLWISIGKSKHKKHLKLAPKLHNYYAAQVDRVSCKKTNNVGHLIRFASLEVMSASVIAHEAAHVAIDIFNQLNTPLQPATQEPAAYLIGWITQCCKTVKDNEKRKTNQKDN